MKARPILWTYFKTKSGEYPIKIRIVQTSNGVTSTKYHPIGASVKLNEWDKKAGRVKNRVNAVEINIKIVETLNLFEKNFITSGVVSAGKQKDLIWWIDEYYNKAKQKHGTYYVKMLNTIRNIVKAYRQSIPFDLLTPKFLDDFEYYLLSKGYHTNNVANILTRVHSVVRDAIKSGALEYHKNPFLHFKIKQIKTAKDRLKYEDILKLESVKLKGNDKLARDMYIFSFYCGGIRFGDLCRLNKTNVDSGRLIYQVSKTKINRNIKLNKKALSIFKSYGFAFPVGIDWKKESESISSKNAFMNRHLKSACEQAGVKNISFHTSRHSLADYAIKKKLTPREIQGILGHTTFNTTEVYLKEIQADENDTAMDKLFG